MVNRFLPNIGDVASNRKELAWPDALHFDTLIAARALNGVLDGCVLSAGTGALDVDVAVGCVVIDGVTKTVAAQTVTLGTGSGQGNPRLDLITVNTSGTVVVEAGAVAGVPVYDAIPASRVVLGGVLVIDGQTAIVAGDINDMGVDLSRQPFVMHRTMTTTGPIDTVAETTVFTYTIPGRALGIDGGVRVSIHGAHLHAVTSHTLKLRVKLGTTEIFASDAEIHTADADPRAFRIIVHLMADGSQTAQKMHAYYRSGLAGTMFIMQVSSSADVRVADGYATVSEDMTADKALVVTAELGDADALNSFLAQLATVERLPPS